MLNASQRASVNLVRCLVKRPDMLVIDGALAPFGEAQKQQLLQLLLESVEDRTLVMVLPHDRATDGFDALIRFRNAQLTMEALRSTAPAQDAPDEEEPVAGKPVERRVAGVSA
jgi:putative ABC transport system ATP-binding protein